MAAELNEKQTKRGGTVHVVARLHPFNETRLDTWVRAGITIAKLLKKIGAPEYCYIKVFVNGEPIEPDKRVFYKLNKHDTVSVRAVPQNVPWAPYAANGPGGTPTPAPYTATPSGGKTPLARMGTIAGLGGGAAALFLATLLGRSGSNTSAAAGNPLAPTATPRPIPPPTNISGQQNILTSPITGISNQDNKWGKIPRVYGQIVVFPPLAAQSFTLLGGPRQYLVAAFCLGPGPLLLTQFRIGTKDLNQTNFPGQLQEQRPGLSSDTPLTLYTNDVIESHVNDQLLYNQQVYEPVPQNCDGISIDVYFPQGIVHYLYNAQGVQTKTTSTVTLLVQGSFNYGALVNLGTWTITDLYTSPLSYNFSVNVGVGPWRVFVTRQTPDSTDPNNINGCFLTVVRGILHRSPVQAIRDHNGVTVPMAYACVRIQSTNVINGTLDQFNCLAFSMIGTWDGTQMTAPATNNNPAWIFVDILTGTTNSRPVPYSRIDWASINAWSDFCRVNNFSFNGVFDQEVSAYQALKDVCAAGRASINHTDGLIGVVIEQKRTVIAQHFTPRNSWGFTAKKTWITGGLPDGILCKFINPYINWQMDQYAVYADGKSLANANKMEAIEFPGVIVPSQLYKLARYHLACMKLRPETYSFNCETDSLVCNRGDLIMVANDVPLWGQDWGIIKSVTFDGSSNITSCTLDETINMVAATTYITRIRTSGNTSVVANVVTVAGNTTTLTFSPVIPAGLPTMPAPGDLVQFGTQPSVELVITAIEHKADFTSIITAVDHSPAVYSSDTDTVPPFNSQITVVPKQQTVVPVPGIYSISTNEAALLRSADGSLNPRMLVIMNQPSDYHVQFWQYQVKRSDSSVWGTMHNVNVNTGQISVPDVEQGVAYDFQVRNVRDDLFISDWVTVANTLIIGKSSPPPDVPSFTVVGTSTGAWYYDVAHGVNPPPDLAGFQIRFNWGSNSNWTQATIYSQLITSSTIDLSGLPHTQPITVMIKAVDTSGNQSVNAAQISMNIGDPIAAMPAIATQNYGPLYTLGTITNGTVSAGTILANTNGSLFWNATGGAAFWGTAGSQFWNASYLQLEYDFSYTPSGSLTGLPFALKMSATVVGESYTIQYSTDNVNWSTWVGFLQNAVVTTYYFKIVCSASSSVQGSISAVTVSVNAPVLQETLYNVSIAAGGTRLPITLTYRSIQLVNVIVFNSVSLTCNVIDKGNPLVNPTTGPLIKLYNTAGTAVAGTIDATVQGY